VSGGNKDIADPRGSILPIYVLFILLATLERSALLLVRFVHLGLS
jgi:hypothetical protein